MQRLRLFAGLLIFCVLSIPTTTPAQSTTRPALSALIVDGMNNHDWQRNTRLLKIILERSGLFHVDVSTSPTAKSPQEDWARWRPDFSRYSVVIDNFNAGDKPGSLEWPADLKKSLEDYVSTGGGLVVYHAANNSFPAWPAFNDMIGLGWRDPTFGVSLTVDADEKIITIPQGQGRRPGHPPERDFQIHVLDVDHPITRGMPKLWLHPHEQLTHGQHGPAAHLHLLTYAMDTDLKENEPLDWVVPYGKGRVYTTMLGHLWANGPDTALRCIGFQTLFLRGAQWAATGEVTIPIPADFPTASEIKTRDFPGN